MTSGDQQLELQKAKIVNANFVVFSESEFLPGRKTEISSVASQYFKLRQKSTSFSLKLRVGLEFLI